LISIVKHHGISSKGGKAQSPQKEENGIVAPEK
jgi:hypothetical protein